MPIMNYAIDLAHVTKDHSGKVGHKAANLGELLCYGFSVPVGFVVNTDAYSFFLKENNLEKLINSTIIDLPSDPHSLEKISKKIQTMIENAELPTEIADEIITHYKALPTQNVAVRSSATSEDLPQESFAGQMETFLNIKGENNLLKQIKRCYASLWTSRAIAYRNKSKIPHDALKMAVIVQVMVKAKSSGVLFTADPVYSERTRLVIESNFGLGESLVSGRVAPDRFIVSRSGEQLKIIAREIGTKSHFTDLNKLSGLDYLELDPEKRRLPSLKDEEILKLAELGCTIEKLFGCPQDIEWAVSEDGMIFILQTRPITSLFKVAPEDEIVWSRGYSDDYWNDPVTPLFFGLLGDHLTNVVNIELNKIMGYSAQGLKNMDQLLRLHRAHVYFNLEVLKKKVEYEIPPFLRNEDILNYFPDGGGPYGKETIKNLPFRLRKRIIAELRVMLFDPQGSIIKTAKAYQKWTKDKFEPFLENFDSRMAELDKKRCLLEYLNLAKELDQLMVGHFRLVRYGIPVHNIGMNLMAQYLLARFLGKDVSLTRYPLLISGLEHKTSETNDRIKKLALKANSSAKVKKIILEVPSDRLFETLSSAMDSEIMAFMQELRSFIKDFGVRGFTREPYYPRWCEAPQYIFDVLKSLIKEDGKIVNDSENLKKQKETEKEIEQMIKSLRFGWFKWKIFSIILGFARKYIVFREDQRFNLDRWITMNRRIYLKIGEILKDKGILQDANEIFFLTKEEIQKLCSDGCCYDELKNLLISIEKRKIEFLKYENTTPPKFLQGMREFNDPVCDHKKTLKGIPASQGLITAPIRVLKSIEEIPQVRAGEIIVVPRTDPGWTPVFCKIGGLITETGGILSHGAVVSREYGIPAVTNIPNACQIFKTGQVVTIDGTNGTVSMDV
ncbi:MAG: PEP-utilizing enzyme [Candidatus Methanomethyliaceae archaeon]|nr:PEP-utilizing enzyme [Candidatus Methanomethyliaceae archaeon]